MSGDFPIYCGDRSEGKLCAKGPLGFHGNGPAYSYGEHYKCEKHHLKHDKLTIHIEPE